MTKDCQDSTPRLSSKQQVIFSFYRQFKNLEASYRDNSENISVETKWDSYKKVVSLLPKLLNRSGS